MRTAWLNAIALAAVALAITLVVIKNVAGDTSTQLLNVSYDPTREVFKDLNRQFVDKYFKQTGKRLTIQQSHGGSSRQAQAVIDGAPADVVTLALSSDVDALRKRGLIAQNWAKRLPNNSEPYTSTIVFVVRKGNPPAIKDWPDLVRNGVTVITPNPKSIGKWKVERIGRLGRDRLSRRHRCPGARIPQTALPARTVLDSGAGDKLQYVYQEKLGDVHLTWENEALLETTEYKGELEIVYPPVSISAEPSVAWVDANVARRKTADYAKAYLEFLYTDQAQEAFAVHGLPPDQSRHSQEACRPVACDRSVFPVTILAKDWEDAQRRIFC